LPAPQFHSDTEIKKKCLNQFLTELKTKHGLNHYCWKAELQCNGNIHFHIVADVFISHEVIRLVWNRCVNKLGYIDKFELKHNHRNPNSTDIEAVRNSKQIGKYISKYIGKSLSLDKFENNDVVNWRRNGWRAYCLKNNISDDESSSGLMMQGKKIAISEGLNSKIAKYCVALGSVDSEIQSIVDTNKCKIWRSDTVSVIEFESFNLLRANCPQLYGILQAVLSDFKSKLN
jgi:hypothetical protein